MALTFKFRADGSGYSRGLQKMRDQTRQWSSSIKGMIGGAFAATAVISLTRQVISFGSEMSDLAARTRTTTREFMTFRDVSRDAGVNQSVLERGLRNVNLRAQEAADGNKTYSDALNRLGIRAGEFVKLSTVEKFEAIAKAANNASDKSEAMADVANILGQRAGPMLVEVLDKVAKEGFDKLAESALAFDDDTAQALDSAEDNIQRFGDRVKITVGGMITAWSRWRDTVNNTKEFEKVDRAAIALLERSKGVRFTGNERNRLSDVSNDLVDKGNILKTKGLSLGDISRARRSIRGEDVDDDDFKRERKKQEERAKEVQHEERRLERIKEAEKIEAKALEAREKAEMDSMTHLQRREHLIGRIADLEAAIWIGQNTNSENSDGRFRLEGAKASLEIVEARKELGKTDKIIKDYQKQLRGDLDSQLSGFFRDLDSRESDLVAKNEQRAGSLEEDFPDLINNENPSLGVVSSSLASVGGGGGVAAFGNDPAMAVQNKQLGVLQKIEAHLNPASGLDAATGLETPEL